MKYYLKYLFAIVVVLNGCSKSDLKKNNLDQITSSAIKSLISNSSLNLEGLDSYTNHNKYVYEKYTNFHMSKIFLNKEMSEGIFFFNSFVNGNLNDKIYKNQMTGEGYCIVAFTEKTGFTIVNDAGNTIPENKYSGYKLYESTIKSCFWKWYDETSNSYKEENNLKKDEKFYTLYKIKENFVLLVSVDLDNERENTYKANFDKIDIVKYEKDPAL